MAIIDKVKLEKMADKINAEAERIRAGDVKTYLKHRKIGMRLWELFAYMGVSAVLGVIIYTNLF